MERGLRKGLSPTSFHLPFPFTPFARFPFPYPRFRSIRGPPPGKRARKRKGTGREGKCRGGRRSPRQKFATTLVTGAPAAAAG